MRDRTPVSKNVAPDRRGPRSRPDLRRGSSATRQRRASSAAAPSWRSRAASTAASSARSACARLGRERLRPADAGARLLAGDARISSRSDRDAPRHRVHRWRTSRRSLDGLRLLRRRDEAIRSVVPDYDPGWKHKIVLPSVTASDIYRVYSVVAQSPDGREIKAAPAASRRTSQIVAATNFKQRTRKTLEYYHADRLELRRRRHARTCSSTTRGSS